MNKFERDLKIKTKYRKIRKRKQLQIEIDKKAKKNYGRSKRLQAEQRNNRNPDELRFREILLFIGEKFIWQQPFSNEERYICVDFYLPKQNIVIEIDGYSHSKTAKYDKDRTKYLIKKHGVKKVVRISVKDLALNYDVVYSYIEGMLKD